MDLSLIKLKEAVALRQQIDTLERRLSSLFASVGPSVAFTSISAGRVRRRRSMSAATRAKLAEAARRRWAQRKSGGGITIGKASNGKRRGLSAAGRRKISEAMKARWAARRRVAGRK